MQRTRRRRRGPLLAVTVVLAGLGAYAGYRAWPEIGPREATAQPDRTELNPTVDPGPAEPVAVRTPAKHSTVAPIPGPKIAPPEPLEMADRPAVPGGADKPALPKTEPKAEVASPGPAPSAKPPEASPAVRQLQSGMSLLGANRLVEARAALTAALQMHLDPADEAAARDALGRINNRLVLGAEVVPGDPFSLSYVVREGDLLANIVREQNLLVDWRLIQRINGIARPESLRVGQRLKLIRGPFHAVIHKASYRIDLFLGEGAARALAANFPVGLGEFGSTPTGRFRVRTGSKAYNPPWTNPRTGQHFAADDPQNPIGDHWIGLEGLDERTRDLSGYGIHGTIEPESIGQQRSMGCVRLLPRDIDVVYSMLVETASTVEIVER